MKRKNENIELLIERFLDGRTTCAEERTLYDYFRTSEIPAEWEYLREAMRYFEQGIGACDAGVLPADAGGGAERRPARQTVASSALRRRRMLPAVAASLVCTLAAATWVLLSSMPGGGGEAGSIYEGSYVLFDGVYCNDVDALHDQIDIAMTRAEIMETKAERLLALADDGAACGRASKGCKH